MFVSWKSVLRPQEEFPVISEMVLDGNNQPSRRQTGETVVPKEAATPTRRDLPVIDILSIGSQRRLWQLKAQQNTFGRNPMIRNFFTVSEKDHIGLEQRCDKSLTKEDITRLVT